MEGENAGLFSRATRQRSVGRIIARHSSIGWTETKGLRRKIMATYRDREVTEEKGSLCTCAGVCTDFARVLVDPGPV